MKKIKLTKSELKRLLANYTIASEFYSAERKSKVEQLVEVCKDLDHACENDLFEIYNAFCRYLGVGGLRVYRMNEFNSLEFEDNIEIKRLTENVDLDDQYLAMDLFAYSGYHSFNDLNSYLKYSEPLNLNNIKNMLEFTFYEEEEEDGEEDE